MKLEIVFFIFEIMQWIDVWSVFIFYKIENISYFVCVLAKNQYYVLKLGGKCEW